MKSINLNCQVSSPSKIQAFRNKKMWNLVASYAVNINDPFTCKDVYEYLNETYGILLDVTIIRKILKEKINYYYKR